MIYSEKHIVRKLWVLPVLVIFLVAHLTNIYFGPNLTESLAPKKHATFNKKTERCHFVIKISKATFEESKKKVTGVPFLRLPLYSKNSGDSNKKLICLTSNSAVKHNARYSYLVIRTLKV